MDNDRKLSPMGELLKSSSIQELKWLSENGDPEVAHAEADKVLCDLLTNLGYKEVVAEFEKLEKWYA